MRCTLTLPNGDKMHLDLPYRSEKNGDLLGAWLMTIFSGVHGVTTQLQYQLEIWP